MGLTLTLAVCMKIHGTCANDSVISGSGSGVHTEAPQGVLDRPTFSKHQVIHTSSG